MASETVDQTHTPVFEIRVRFHGLNPKPGMMTLPVKSADLEQTREVAARWANGLGQPGGTIPAEVLVVGEWGPVDRWLDGHRAALESLTPGHPGGCPCGECIIRWQHREGDPRHEPCTHGTCPVCTSCGDCDWDEVQRHLQEFAASRLTGAGDAIETALTQVHAARTEFVRLRRELSETEMDIGGLPGGDITAAIAKLDRLDEELEDVARIVEAAQLRAKVTELDRKG